MLLPGQAGLERGAVSTHRDVSSGKGDGGGHERQVQHRTAASDPATVAPPLARARVALHLAPLLVFREKLEAKSGAARGLFISINGYAPGMRAGIVRGRVPNFLMLDGMHLFRVLSGDTDLVALLRAARRHAPVPGVVG